MCAEYTDDNCRQAFTDGQVSRIQTMWQVYRSSAAGTTGTGSGSTQTQTAGAHHRKSGEETITEDCLTLALVIQSNMYKRDATAVASEAEADLLWASATHCLGLVLFAFVQFCGGHQKH